MADQKDTIYIDIDDDITAIIDKVNGAKSNIVAMVLPKRATVLQSQVNMKLLKRAADDAGKNLVLITGESGLMPLAGAAGVYVAKTLSSKPEVPSAEALDDSDIDVDEPEDLADKFDARASEAKPIGEVAGVGAAASKAATSELGDDDTIELDNSDEIPESASKEPQPEKPKKGKDKKKKIPNFSRFRDYAILAVLALIGLGVLFYFALEVWPHATVKIYTSQTQVPTNFVANFSTNANHLDPADEIIPAVTQTEQKSYSQTIPASGQKDTGSRATGDVDLTVCASKPGDVQTVPAGTGVSTSNLTYITQEDANFSYDGACPNGDFKFKAQGIAITAQSPGSNYNVQDGSFSVASPYDNVTGRGEASGGTSNLVRVVQQSDIDSAKSKLQNQSTSGIKQELKSSLIKSGVKAMPETFTALPSDVSSSANPGDQVDNVTVTENVTYVMFGYAQTDLENLVKANVANQISDGQGILDYGLAGASFKLNGTPTAQSAGVSISTSVTIGPKLDKAKLSKQLAGKKAGEIRSDLGSLPGVSKVEVDTSPFWVGSAPKDPSKVTIEFEKSSS